MKKFLAWTPWGVNFLQLSIIGVFQEDTPLRNMGVLFFATLALGMFLGSWLTSGWPKPTRLVLLARTCGIIQMVATVALSVLLHFPFGASETTGAIIGWIMGTVAVFGASLLVTDGNPTLEPWRSARQPKSKKLIGTGTATCG